MAAEAAFRRGLALQPEDAGLRSGLAAAHAELAAVDPARADSALHAYLGLVRGGSTDPGAYRTTVDLLLRRGERCEAAALALAALEAPGPANAAPVDGGRGAPLSWEEAGRLCLDLRAYAQAFHLYDEGGPGEGDGLARARILAHFYDRLGWNERAAAAYEEILRRAPEGPAALDETRRLAELLRGAGNLVAASERWRQVVAREPGVLRNHYELASVLLDAGRPEEAAEAAERGLAEEPSWLCLWYLRGESIESRGQRREEAGAFDEAIRLYTEARDSFARAAGDPQCGERAARQVERQEALIARARALRDQPAGR